jgi:hypothetical protein
MGFLGSVIRLTRPDKIRDNDDDDASDKLSAELNECRNNWENRVQLMTANLIPKTNDRLSALGIKENGGKTKLEESHQGLGPNT